jgi:hypothetical protein
LRKKHSELRMTFDVPPMVNLYSKPKRQFLEGLASSEAYGRRVRVVSGGRGGKKLGAG